MQNQVAKLFQRNWVSSSKEVSTAAGLDSALDIQMGPDPVVQVRSSAELSHETAARVKAQLA